MTLLNTLFFFCRRQATKAPGLPAIAEGDRGQAGMKIQ